MVGSRKFLPPLVLSLAVLYSDLELSSDFQQIETAYLYLTVDDIGDED